MNSAIDKQDHFDHGLKQLHAAAVSHLSPQTLARLRAARHGAVPSAPQRSHAWRWLAASAFSAVLAVVVGVQFLPPSQSLPSAQPVAAGNDGNDAGNVATLEESPDLYLWLASQDAATLAME